VLFVAFYDVCEEHNDDRRLDRRRFRIARRRAT
jgi:hypothetical protein